MAFSSKNEIFFEVLQTNKSALENYCYLAVNKTLEYILDMS